MLQELTTSQECTITMSMEPYSIAIIRFCDVNVTHAGGRIDACVRGDAAIAVQRSRALQSANELQAFAREWRLEIEPKDKSAINDAFSYHY